MKKLFLDYMADRFSELDKHIELPGPVITISREYGCSAVVLAKSLITRLNNQGESQWHWINRRIIEESAKELNVSKARIQHIFESKEKSFLSDLMLSFSESSYTSDTKIRRTISRVIHSFANKGFVVIVGSAGAVICQNISRAVHIRLYAPLDWRIDHIAEEFGITRSAAINRISNMDYKRDLLIESFMKKKFEYGIFDVAFNRATLDENTLVENIHLLLKQKKIIS